MTCITVHFLLVCKIQVISCHPLDRWSLFLTSFNNKPWNSPTLPPSRRIVNSRLCGVCAFF